MINFVELFDYMAIIYILPPSASTDNLNLCFIYFTLPGRRLFVIVHMPLGSFLLG